jgi:hypothetical protein
MDGGDRWAAGASSGLPMASRFNSRGWRPSVKFLNFRIFACRLTEISNNALPSRSSEGRFANVTNAERDAVDAGGVFDESADADGEVVWF